MVEKHEHFDEEEYQEETLATPGVIDKYQAAGKIANGKHHHLIKKIIGI